MTLADITAEPEESEKVVKKTMAVRMDRVPLRYHMKKDKTVFPVEASTSMFDLGGRKVICVVIRDITDRKRTEEAVKDSEERYRTLFERTANPILVTDTDGNYINSNNSALRFFQCTQDELLSKNIFDFMPPDRKEQVLDIKKPIWKSGGSVETEYNIHGNVKFMELTVTPTTWQGKNVILGIGKDITKRKQAEERLRESERRLADIIDFLPDATLAIDRQGKVIAWNRAIEEMTGVKAHEMLGKGDYEYALPFYAVRRPILLDLVLKPDKKIEQSYYSILNKQKDLLIVETWVPYLKEKKAFLWAKASPLYDSRGDIVGAIESIRDITERKQAEEVLGKREMELEAKTSELEDLNAALRVLLKQREEDRNEFEQKVLSNVKVLILPHIEKLKNHMDMKNMTYLNVLESNLKDIISPFAKKLSAQYLNLTNREVQVANLIKEGKTTKEIAAFLNVSDSAVNVYRYHIRRKLSLTKKHNLRSYMSSIV
jgi:PAS domain S-box-containing protein